MMSTEPWQRAMAAGTSKAKVLSNPDQALRVIREAKRPILVVGHESVEGGDGREKPISYIIRFAKASNIPVVATAHTVREFNLRGFSPAGSMPAVDIATRLRDPSWEGLDGNGPYDLVIIMGMPYYMEWLLFAGLKHFSNNLTLVSLDRFYQPHATWSFPNISLRRWQKNIDEMTAQLEGE